MNDLGNLYKQIIIDHYRNPRNKKLKGFINEKIKNYNCGDEITVEIKIEDDVVKEINFDGSGCSICCSSASIMTEIIKDKTIDKSIELIENFYDLLKTGSIENKEELNEALCFQYISKFPARINCAILSWKVLEKLINKVKK